MICWLYLCHYWAPCPLFPLFVTFPMPLVDRHVLCTAILGLADSQKAPFRFLISDGNLQELDRRYDSRYCREPFSKTEAHLVHCPDMVSVHD